MYSTKKIVELFLSCMYLQDVGNKENAASASNAKQQLLTLLSRHRANALCKTNDDNFVCSVNAHELDVSTTDLGSTLGRAVR